MLVIASVDMSQSNGTRKNNLVSKKPYLRARKTKSKPKAMNLDESVSQLNIHAENMEYEDNLLKSDSECSSGGSIVPSITHVRDEMIQLLKEIRKSQSAQCTKNDLFDYGQKIGKQFKDIDKRVTSNTSSITSMTSRMNTLESQLDINKHEAELVKQSILARNLSIMGVPATQNEDLTAIALKLFSRIGCNLRKTDIFGGYRIRKGNLASNIFIIKINDFSIKHQILKAKVNKEIKLKDVVDGANVDALIYINNHVTPFFGNLLSEGRKAVKEKKVHAVWLTKSGCHLRFDMDGQERIYRSINEFHRLISSNNANSSKRSKPDDSEISPNSKQQSKK